MNVATVQKMKLTPAKVQAGIGASLLGCVIFGIIAAVFFPRHAEIAHWGGTAVGVLLYAVTHFHHRH